MMLSRMLAPGPRLDARIVKTELETFSIINEGIIRQIVKRANEQMSKVRKKISADEFSFRYSEEPTKELWYDTFSHETIIRTYDNSMLFGKEN